MKNTIYMNEGGLPQYEVIKYPAGEKQVRLTEYGIKQCLQAEQINILHRGVPDVMELTLLCDAVGRVAEHIPVRLVLPYLPYSRADRRFTEGDCAGLAVFGNLLNGLHLDEVVTLDVHSSKAERFVPRLRNVPPTEYACEALRNIVLHGSRHVTILYPDEGAVERYRNPFKGLHVAHATKIRDPKTGKLSGFKVPTGLNEQVLIVDDICDGGGTFLGIANELPRETKKFLYVSHGIFSKGFSALKMSFERIYTTDSLSQLHPHPDWGPPFTPKVLTVFEAVKDLL